MREKNYINEQKAVNSTSVSSTTPKECVGSPDVSKDALGGSVVKKRVGWIDISRAIFIISVIVYHARFMMVEVTPGGLLVYNIISIYFLTGFFIISGYMYRPKDIKTTIIGTAQNTLLPYATSCLIWLVPILLGIKFYGDTLGKGAYRAFFYGAGTTNWVLPHDFIKHQIGVIWFLPCMFFASAIFHIVMKLLSKKPEVVRLIVFATISSVALFSSEILNLWAPLSFINALAILIFMYAGYLMRKVKFLEKKSLLVIAFCIIACIPSVYINGFAVVNMAGMSSFYAIVAGTLAPVVIFYISMLLEKVLGRFSRVLERIGEASIIVMCMHHFDLQVFKFSPYLAWLISQKTGHYSALFQNVLIGVFSICIPVAMVFIYGKIPLFRSLYNYRKYPLFKRKQLRS